MKKETIRKWVAITCLLAGVAALSARKYAVGASAPRSHDIHKEDIAVAGEYPLHGGHLHSSPEGEDRYFDANGRAFVVRRWRLFFLPSFPPAAGNRKGILPEVCR